jgi:hypothetical protein
MRSRVDLIGAPEKIRTSDLCLRRATLEGSGAIRRRRSGFIFDLRQRDLRMRALASQSVHQVQDFRPPRTRRPFPGESAVVILLVSLLRYHPSPTLHVTSNHAEARRTLVCPALGLQASGHAAAHHQCDGEAAVVSAMPFLNSSSVRSYSQAGMTWMGLSASSRMTPIGSWPAMTALTCAR